METLAPSLPQVLPQRFVSVWKSPKTNPIKDEFCVMPYYAPERVRELVDSIDLQHEGLNKSRNAKIMAMFGIALRQINPLAAQEYEKILTDYEVEAVHAFIQRFGAAVAVVLVVCSMLLGFDVRRPSRSTKTVTTKTVRRQNETEA